MPSSYPSPHWIQSQQEVIVSLLDPSSMWHVFLHQCWEIFHGFLLSPRHGLSLKVNPGDHLTKLTRPFVLTPRYLLLQSHISPLASLWLLHFIHTQLRKLPLSPLDTYAPLSFCTEHFFPWVCSTSSHPSSFSLGVTSTGKPLPAPRLGSVALLCVLSHSAYLSVVELWVSQLWDWVAFTPSLPLLGTVPDSSCLDGWVTEAFFKSNILCHISWQSPKVRPWSRVGDDWALTSAVVQ